MAKERKRTAPASATDSASIESSTPSADDTRDDRDPRDRIAMRAYELYLSRGARDGADFDDWLAAERELAGGRDILPHGDPDE
jgi:hypothetical protein